MPFIIFSAIFVNSLKIQIIKQIIFIVCHSINFSIWFYAFYSLEAFNASTAPPWSLAISSSWCCCLQLNVAYLNLLSSKPLFSYFLYSTTPFYSINNCYIAIYASYLQRFYFANAITSATTTTAIQSLAAPNNAANTSFFGCSIFHPVSSSILVIFCQQP